ncbi:MAG: hypothetical protein M0042_10610 [Nitrospiraceae bacterium]|nr:hypothetical protein [Nitrospiraceae bacterium]
MEKYADNAIALLAGLLFFLMLFTPRSYQFVKIPPLAILVLFILARVCVYGTLPVHRTVLLWFLCYLSYGAVWILIGSFRGNPGIQDYIRINLVWVILYGLLIAGIHSRRTFDLLLNMLPLSALAIAAYNISVLLKFLGLIPDNILTHLDLTAQEVAVGTDVGVFRMTAHNIGTLAFIGPYLMALAILREKNTKTAKNVLHVAFILSFLTILLSGRRAIWFIIAGTPLVIYLFNLFNLQRKSVHTRRIRTIVVSMMVFVLLSGFALQIYTAWSFADVKEFIDLALHEDDIRSDQSDALMRGFQEHYLVGSGFGTGARDYVRNNEQPWVYELSYHVLLFNTGILGVFIYGACIAWIYYKGIQVMRRDTAEAPVMISLLTGMTTFLLANATNPYLFSYDFMWILFLPIAHINLVMLRTGAKDYNPDYMTHATQTSILQIDVS